ncbi:MAG: ATP-binding protein [Candidatus Cloacimonetes bacterium]|nr:ATP-binding protein [Candidatus Cloacimonadota bacterium]
MEQIIQVFVSLVYNAALLLALVLLFDSLAQTEVFSGSISKMKVGLVLGAIALGIMLNPMKLHTGVVFDSRTVFFSVASMFFDPLSVVIAALMAAGFRLSLGGAGIYTGVSTIISSMGFGFLFRRLHHRWKKPYGFWEFYSLGIVVHISMVLLMNLTPPDMRSEIIRVIMLPALLLFPLGTVLLGHLVHRRLKRYEECKKMERSEAQYRLLAETSNDIIFIRDTDDYIIYANKRAQELMGISPEDYHKVKTLKFVAPAYLEETVRRQRINSTLAGEKELFILEVIDKYGEHRMMESNYGAIWEDGVFKGVMVAARDVTDRIKTEEARARYAARLEILKELDKMVLDVNSFENSLEKASKMLQKLIPFDILSVNKFQGEKLEIVELLKPAERFAFLHKNQKHAFDADIIAELGENKDYVEVAGTKTLIAMPVRMRLEKDGITSHQYNALLWRGEVLGFLWFSAFAADAFTAEHLEIARDFAKQLALIFDHRKQMEQIQNNSQVLVKTVEDRTAQLKSAITELESFSYTVAHDLRSPLKMIQNYCDILLEDYGKKLDAEGNKMLENINAIVVRSDKLTMELLDLARLNLMGLQKEDVNMEAIVKEIVNSQNTQGFEIEYLAIPPAWGDASLLRQVWQNFIENALKYTRDSQFKKITIGTKVGDEGYIYYVKDTGIGFLPEKADSIFAPFERLHKSEGYDGTGIGLAITKKIILFHDGDTWAESEVGKGSIFYFWLPMKEV